MAQKKKQQFIDSNAIPCNYDTTQFTLIARDPQTIYAYWNISQEKINDFCEDKDVASFIIRMYDVTLIDFNGSNANHFFDVNIDLSSSNWYINLWSDNVTYCAEIGIKTYSGEFHSIIRSNYVTTPRAFFSEKTDLTWMEVKEDKEHKPEIISQTLAEHTRGSFKHRKVKPSFKPSKSKKWTPLSRDEIRTYYANLFPLLRGISRDATDEEIKAKARSLHDLDSMDFLTPGLTLGEFYKRIILGSSAEMVLKGKAEGGASEQNFGFLDTGASEQQYKQRKFFFEIGTELIVYGRTEPDAKVILGDKEIKLREDGTFTLRFALPDNSKIPLDFTATSADGEEKRSIITSASRSKTKHKNK